MKQTIRVALLAAALGLPCAAQAGQLTLYTDVHFDGRAVTVRDAVPDLSQIGFNDRASSMVIASGRWQVCVDAGFRGYCEVFERGDYAIIKGFNDSISSVREVSGPGRDNRRERGNSDDQDWRGGRDDDGREHDRHEQDGREHDRRDREQGWRGKGGVLLFSGSDFGGARVTLQRDTRNLGDLDFNDQTGSIVVQDGQWELCVHADFGGQCRLYGPGRYPWLGNMDHQISSARRLR